MFRIQKGNLLLVYGLLALFLSLFWFPIVWILLTSVRSRSETLSYPPVWLFRPTFEGFSYLFSSSEFVTSLLNSVYVAIFSTLVTLALAVPAAYALARFDFPTRENLGFYIISTKMTPPCSCVICLLLTFC